MSTRERINVIYIFEGENKLRRPISLFSGGSDDDYIDNSKRLLRQHFNMKSVTLSELEDARKETDKWIDRTFRLTGGVVGSEEVIDEIIVIRATRNQEREKGEENYDKRL